jgi:HD superfamily phosphohydrolase
MTNPETRTNEIAPEKIIRDAVHGYIHIESDYFKKIIDTPNFQRLKRLEQTNVRPLYPCAHHDRFIHSLGVYHLGKTAFHFLKKNSGELFFHWDGIQKNFELACLLHDIGHAPFSHTFEKFYDNDEKTSLDELLTKSTISEKKWKEEKTLFLKDYKKKIINPAPHEKISAILVLTEYYETLVEITSINPFLIARMILGLNYNDDNEKHQFHNCFISLLNSDYIDVDKLDYYARDQWATGHISKTVDFERLFSSIYIRPYNGAYVICFHKRAIDDILAMIETKKMIAVSMHSHHIVKYDEYILIRAIEEIASKISPNSGDVDPIRKIISIEALSSSKPHNVENFKFHLLTDDDLIYILKNYMSDPSSYAYEWFSRNYRLKAVWKTFADYKYFFRKFDDEHRIQLFKNKEDIVENFLKQNSITENIKDQYYTVQTDTEYNPILTPKIKIFIKEEVRDLKDLRDAYNEEEERNKNKRASFFLLYLPKGLLEKDKKREEFIEFVIMEVNKKTKENKSNSN